MNSGPPLFFRASANYSKILNEKVYSIQWKIAEETLFSRQAQVVKILNVKSTVYSLQWNFSGQLCFSRQARVAQKSWMIKVYSVQWKFSGQLYFSGQARVAEKSWMIKYIFNAVKIFRPPSVFQGKRKLLKNPQCKKCVQYSQNFRGNSVFLGQVRVAQKFWMITCICNTVKSGQLCFSGQVQVAQKSWMIKSIFNTVKNFWATLFSGQAALLKNSE